MNSELFWKIMDEAFVKGGFDIEIKEQLILEQLIKLTPEQIQEFEIIFQKVNLEASTWNNMAAHTVIDGGSSDDTFFYFRCWLISLGKQNFDAVMKDPDYLASLNIPINKKYGYGEVDFEALISIADRAYSIVTAKQEEDDTFPRAMAHLKGLFYDSATRLTGAEWSDEDLPKIVPRLIEKFGSQ